MEDQNANIEKAGNTLRRSGSGAPNPECETLPATGDSKCPTCAEADTFPPIIRDALRRQCPTCEGTGQWSGTPDLGAQRTRLTGAPGPALTRERGEQKQEAPATDSHAGESPEAAWRRLFEPLPEWMFGESVEARNALQKSGRVHPYTCGNNECRSATNGAPLLAVEGGWSCERCGYTQRLRSSGGSETPATEQHGADATVRVADSNSKLPSESRISASRPSGELK